MHWHSRVMLRREGVLSWRWGVFYLLIVRCFLGAELPCGMLIDQVGVIRQYAYRSLRFEISRTWILSSVRLRGSMTFWVGACCTRRIQKTGSSTRVCVWPSHASAKSKFSLRGSVVTFWPSVACVCRRWKRCRGCSFGSWGTTVPSTCTYRCAREDPAMVACKHDYPRRCPADWPFTLDTERTDLGSGNVAHFASWCSARIPTLVILLWSCLKCRHAITSISEAAKNSL